jgi:hypothetical protein
MSPYAGGGGGLRGVSQWVKLCTWSPNKLWSSNYIFNQWQVANAHCKEPILNIRNNYSQKRNCVAAVPISTFMCLWAVLIFPRLICLFRCRKYVDWSWEYINHSQTHEYGNWDWGFAIPRIGTYKWVFSLHCRYWWPPPVAVGRKCAKELTGDPKTLSPYAAPCMMLSTLWSALCG